jgi:hypothetical protein
MVFKRGSVVEKPGLPTNILVREDLVDKLHEQALVLQLEILDPKTASILGGLNLIPGHKTFGAVADVVTSLEKGTAPPINELDNSFRDIKGRHEMQRDGAEDDSTKSEAAGTVKKGRTPARQVLVTGGKERETVVHRDFMGRERQAKVGLGEGGDGGAKKRSHITSNLSIDRDGEESCFVEVNRKTSGSFKMLEDEFGVSNGIIIALEEDKSIVSVLKHRGRVARNEGVANGGS